MTATRRTLFGLLAAPAITALPALAAPHPDAEILELERQRLIASEAYVRIAQRADELHVNARALFPPKPEALRARRNDWFGWSGPHVDARGFYSSQGLAIWRDAINHPVKALMWTYEVRAREILTADAAYAAACEAVYVATGARRASDMCDAACATLGDIEDRILTAPATTPEGRAIKARMVAHIVGDEPDGTREDFAFRGLLADLLAEARA